VSVLSRGPADKRPVIIFSLPFYHPFRLLLSWDFCLGSPGFFSPSLPGESCQCPVADCSPFFEEQLRFPFVFHLGLFPSSFLIASFPFIHRAFSSRHADLLRRNVSSSALRIDFRIAYSSLSGERHVSFPGRQTLPRPSRHTRSNLLSGSAVVRNL